VCVRVVCVFYVCVCVFVCALLGMIIRNSDPLNIK